MIPELSPEAWILFGLIMILYGIGSFIAGYYIGKKSK